MASAAGKSTIALGFLTVVEHKQHGLFGGYLVLNHVGRPLEFHCTAPVKPNRAQEILYGPTLEPYLFGEQIGRTLVAKGSHRPMLVCTDRRPALAVREHIDQPVVLVEPGDEGKDELEGVRQRLDGPHAGTPAPRALRHGSVTLAVAPEFDDDRELVADLVGRISAGLDLAEPFERIREAIQEAQRSGR